MTLFRASSRLIYLGGVLILIYSSAKAEVNISTDTSRVMTLSEFVQEATQKDTEFEQILTEQLKIQYQKGLRLPAGDLVAEVKASMVYYDDQAREEPEHELVLSKLFPITGTELSAGYSIDPSLVSSLGSSQLSFTIAQPIAENAFGYNTRLLDKIIGLENDVASYQIAEAYEDYLATVITAYYSWYEAYENFKVGQSSYKENLKLLDNIKARQRSRIALPIDVNKITLQVLAKKEDLIRFEERYLARLHVIERMIRWDGGLKVVPAEPNAYEWANDFEKAFEEFQDRSRTYETLDLLEKRSDLVVAREANDLLPSIDLFGSYRRIGNEEWLEEPEDIYQAGVTIEWIYPDDVEGKEIAKINARQQKLESLNTHFQIQTQLKNLYQEIKREDQLIEVANEKIRLAQSVLKDEAENYSFGKVTLNDYIQAVNTFDNNRFNQISRDALHKKLIIEWLRLTDRLVQDKDLTSPSKN